MCVLSPSAGTGAGELHVELCVPNENHEAYSVAPSLNLNGKSNNLTVSIIFDNPHMLNIRFISGAASRCGAGSTKMMRLRLRKTG
jgi:hypothetical protein